MQLDAISVFIKVVQAGSFNRAAQQLAMPNSTVSAKVASLEKDLGVTLLQRTTRKLNVTEAGQAYFDKCVRALSEIEAAEQEIKTAQKQLSGVLRVTSPTDFGQSVLPQIAQLYLKKYPQVKLELLVTNRVVDLLGEGVDLAIRAGELEDSSFISKRLNTGSLTMWASPGYVKKNGTPSHPRDLEKFDLIGFAPMAGKKMELQNGSEKIKLNLPPSRITVDDTVAARALAMLGEGIAFLPSFLCNEEFRRAKLVAVLSDWKLGGDRSFTFLYPAQRYASAKVQSFISLSTEVLNQCPS